MGVPVFRSIRTSHIYCEKRVVSENEQRVPIGATKNDIERTLWHIDLTDQFPRGS